MFTGVLYVSAYLSSIVYIFSWEPCASACWWILHVIILDEHRWFLQLLSQAMIFYKQLVWKSLHCNSGWLNLSSSLNPPGTQPFGQHVVYIFDHGDFFRNLLKFVWAQIFNIWDSKDDKLMPFDYIWHHSTLLDTISTLLDTIRHYFDTIRHYWTLLGHY